MNVQFFQISFRLSIIHRKSFAPTQSIDGIHRLQRRKVLFIFTVSFVNSFTVYFDRFQAILHLHTSLAYGQFLREDSKFLLFSSHSIIRATFLRLPARIRIVCFCNFQSALSYRSCEKRNNVPQCVFLISW